MDQIVYCTSNGNYVNVHHLQEGKLNKKVWSGSLARLMKEELSGNQFVRISSKNSINRAFLRGTAGNRRWCVLNRADLPKEIRLVVPERKRKEVWKELL